MIEVELKAVLPDLARARALMEKHGAALVFAGRLEDRRYDTPGHELLARDHVLRLRVYRDASGSRAVLDWKGPTGYDRGYKQREELSTAVADADALVEMLEQLGYEVTMEINREIWQYELDGATIRLERYPRLDDLVEVEGAPDAIERAIERLGIPRSSFTTERLPDFVKRFEERTGRTAALSDAALAGKVHYDFRNG